MEYNVKLQGLGEKAMFDLRSLYESYGYRQFRMSKFEEYDFYAQNRNFITGSSILTFTDTNGHLMALKPDITLSIIKGSKIGANFDKVYYNESVYRAADSLSGFREIRQTGLECIGNLDLYTICEVVSLAAMSLAAISGDYILDISHMGLLSGFFSDSEIPYDLHEQLLVLAEAKNIHDARLLCNKAGIPQRDIDTLTSLILLRGTLNEALTKLRTLPLGEQAMSAVRELEDVSQVLQSAGLGKNIYIDLSLQSNPGYYNGLVFKGYIAGVPSAILSGGRYDGLLRKMGKDAGAMGFAVYLNLLENLYSDSSQYDVDVLILQSGRDDAAELLRLVKNIIDGGETCRVDVKIPEGLKYRRLLQTDGGK